MPEKILVVNMNYLGDALFTTPALHALRLAYPQAQIDTIVGAGAAAEVLRGNPDVDAIHFRKARGGFARIRELVRLLRGGRYTQVIILPPLPAYALAAWLARTPRRVGQGGRGMDFFLTERRTVTGAHFVERFLQTAPVTEDSGPHDNHLRVNWEPHDEQAARRLLVDAGINPERPFVAVNVGATKPQNRWPALSFAGAIDLLADVPCVLVGAGVDDAQIAADVLTHVRESRPVNLVGQTNVKELAALLAASAVTLSADTGPLHLATAVGTPVVALFGSTDPARCGPFEAEARVLDAHLSCSPCGKRPTCAGRFDCMKAITPADAAFAVRDLLRAGRGAVLPMAREVTR